MTVGVPKVTCLTNIYHPNIDPESWDGDEGNVCLNILNDWPPSYGLQDCIQGILFLLHNPNLDDPLAPYFDDAYEKGEFPEKVRSSIRGEDVDGFTFGASLTATETTTSTAPQPDGRELDGTFGLENIFADQNQDVAHDDKNAFPEQEQEDVVCAEKVFAEQTEENVTGHENICGAQNQEDMVGQEVVFAEQNQEDTVGHEKICVGQKQELSVSLENTYADDETVVDMADGAAVEQTHHTVEAGPLVEDCRHLIVIPSSGVMLHQPHAKRASLILVYKHSGQTVTRRLFKLLGVAATRARRWFSPIQRQPVERSNNCYECIV